MELRELLREHKDDVWFYVIFSRIGNLIYFGYHPDLLRKTFLERKVIEYEEIQTDNIKKCEVVVEIDY